MDQPQTSQATTRRLIISSLKVGVGLATLLVPILVVLCAFSDHAMVFYAIRNATSAQLEAQGTIGQWTGDPASATAFHRYIVIDRDMDQIHLVESRSPESGSLEVHQDDFWITYKSGPTSLAIAAVFAILSLILTAVISAMRFAIRMIRPFFKERTPPPGFEIVPRQMPVAASVQDVEEGR